MKSCYDVIRMLYWFYVFLPCLYYFIIDSSIFKSLKKCPEIVLDSWKKDMLANCSYGSTSFNYCWKTSILRPAGATTILLFTSIFKHQQPFKTFHSIMLCHWNVSPCPVSWLLLPSVSEWVWGISSVSRLSWLPWQASHTVPYISVLYYIYNWQCWARLHTANIKFL